MSIAHVIYSIVTQKKMKLKKTYRHIEIMIFITFFVNRFFRTLYEKKSSFWLIGAIKRSELLRHTFR